MNTLTIESVSIIQRGTDLDNDIYCHIKFAEVSFAVPFYANRKGDEEFQKTMWTRLNAGEFGEVTFPPSNYPTHPKTQTQLELEAREERDTLLLKSDWTEASSALTSPQKSSWSTYRQALREVPNQAGFPYEITWPTKP
jgi:hypothetical protein